MVSNENQLHSERQGEGNPRSQGLRVWSNKGSPYLPWGELIRRRIGFGTGSPKAVVFCTVGASPLLAPHTQIPRREVGLSQGSVEATATRKIGISPCWVRREGSQVSPGAVSQVHQSWGISFTSRGRVVLSAPNST